MTLITIAKRTDAQLNEPQRNLLAGVLFDMFGGLTVIDHKRWRNLWRVLMSAGSGEVFTLKITIQRDGVFHRKHMKLESVLFEAQEVFYSFTQFRNWLKVGAGFVDWHVVRGQLVPEPKSISYDECDQLEMEEFHNNAIAFLRTARAQSELWPYAPPLIRERSTEALLLTYERHAE